MTTHLFPKQQLREYLCDAEEIGSEYWRHGRRITYVFGAFGEHWRVTVDVHHDDGIQIYGDTLATLVHRVPKTVWVWEET